MKSFRTFSALMAFSAVCLAGYAADAEPAYLDFSQIAPSKGGQFVEIDLDQGILALASKFAEIQEKEAAQILRGLKHVRVHVISLDNTNRAMVVERIETARSGLAKDGWKRIALVKDENAQDVAVYARIQGTEAIEGLAVTVIDGDKQAVVVNVVGKIKPEQITALGSRFNIEPLKKIIVAKN